MPKLDKTGPEGIEGQLGRKLGNCYTIPDEERLRRLGTGMGKANKKDGCNKKSGKRLLYNQ